MRIARWRWRWRIVGVVVVISWKLGKRSSLAYNGGDNFVADFMNLFTGEEEGRGERSLCNGMHGCAFVPIDKDTAGWLGLVYRGFLRE